MSVPSSRESAVVLAPLWDRVQAFCLDRGWDAELAVREDGNQFGRVAAIVHTSIDRFCGYGWTTNEAIRNLLPALEREGFR